MNLKTAIEEFQDFLVYEKGQATNTVEAYARDMQTFSNWLNNNNIHLNAEDIQSDHIRQFLIDLAVLDIASSSQARILAGIKSFFTFLLYQNIRQDNPCALVETPKRRQKLPAVLSIQEVEAMMAAIDHSKWSGHRDRAILETLYSCGLRVTELIDLKISQLFFDVGFIRVIGKRNKERIIPIGNLAMQQIDLYLKDSRKKLPLIRSDAEDIVFLTKSGRKLSRVMIFLIVKDLAEKAAIQKNVSPHTFRHSFATHLVEGGADLRAIQQMLGHESITTTELYTHLDQTYLRENILLYHPANKKTSNK